MLGRFGETSSSGQGNKNDVEYMVSRKNQTPICFAAAWESGGLQGQFLQNNQTAGQILLQMFPFVASPPPTWPVANPFWGLGEVLHCCPLHSAASELLGQGEGQHTWALWAVAGRQGHHLVFAAKGRRKQLSPG